MIAASLPPPDLVGLDPSWSRLVTITDLDRARREFHLLDSGQVDGQLGTVLCVHGNPTWSYLWRGLVADPPTGWRVIAVDQLGMGWSERLDSVRRLADRVDDLGRLTSALGLDGPVVTVAHDWGGPVSLGWALAHADQLAGVVLTNTGVHQPPGSAAPRLIRMARSPVLLDFTCRATPVFVRGTTGLSRPRPPKHVRDAFAAPYRSRLRRRAIGDFVADIPLEAEHPSTSALDEIAEGVRGLSVPVLLAWGPSDPVFSDRYLRDLVERMPHADVHRYEGASHLVTEDAPAAIGDIKCWIEQLPRDPVATGQARPDGPVGREVTEGRRSMLSALDERANDPTSAQQVAVIEAGGSGASATWWRLKQVVDELAAGLASRGVRPGDRVALLVPPGLDLTASIYACWRIGAVVVVADAGLGVRGLARALRGAWPNHIIAVERGLVAARLLGIGGRRFAAGRLGRRRARLLGAEATLAELAVAGRAVDGLGVLADAPTPEAEAAVVFTSGATGSAKGVVYRHRQVEANRDALIELFSITADDRLVAAFAPFALYGPALGIPSAAPDMDVTKPATLDAPRLSAAVAALNATLVWASPASLRNVCSTATELDQAQLSALHSVRLVMSAGAPVPLALLQDVGRLFPAADLHTPYGMTEVLPVADIDVHQLAALPDDHGICVGRAVAGAEVRIDELDEWGHPKRGEDAREGVTGEVLVRAPWVKDRYDHLSATEAATKDGGWHRTGDVGHLDSLGRLWIEGRLVHVISTAAGPVTPVGIEQRIEALPSVSAAAAVGIGPEGGQVIIAVVVATAAQNRRGCLAPPELAAEVRSSVECDVAAVLVRDALPVDIRHNSKVDRAALSRWADQVLA